MFTVRTIRNTIHKDSVRTSQETHYVSATKTSWLSMFREIADVYCENRAELYCDKTLVSYSGDVWFESRPGHRLS
jgi:hypothetical protein